MKTIPLTQGKSAMVDDADYEWLSAFRWFCVFDGYNHYAATKIKGKTVAMHRMILSASVRKLTVDHIDHNGLNNQKKNLRPCTHRENLRNMNFRKVSNTSGFKGVSWKERIKRWIAQIKVNDEVLHLGTFIKKEDAALAYDAAACKYFGEFSCTNRSLGLLDYKGNPVSPRRVLRTNNKSGCKGIHWNRFIRKWQARVTVDGKRITVGSFRTLKAAIKGQSQAINMHDRIPQFVGRE